MGPCITVHHCPEGRTLVPRLSTCFYFLIYFIDFVQRGKERDRELETSMRESHRSAASCAPPTGDVPTTKVHALDRNRTRDLAVPKPTLYPLSQTGFGVFLFFKYILIDTREKGRERETSMMRENHRTAVFCTHIPHTGDLARNPGMCPDQESNRDLLVHRLTLQH
uniref:Uncharacterized protein n=1 Tax=Pipistrellus kuhlii TaxID=59472 RepID=A0A7J7TP18_PIPKU|nr:hypothetical protein mPipKuh1_009299 [Pipistrellus kuhlii]